MTPRHPADKSKSPRYGVARVISKLGLGSRTQAMQWVREGRVRVNGRLEVIGCILSDEVMRLGDREMLEDLIQAAANQAVAKVRQLIAEETSKMASNLGKTGR